MSFKKCFSVAAVLAASSICSSSNAALHDPPRWLTPELREIQISIESIGVPTFWQDAAFCEEGVAGLYSPSFGVVQMCTKALAGNYQEMLATLKHEGWHVVQHRCNNYRSAFKDSVIAGSMNAPERQVLHKYHPKERRLEAEARLVEKIPTSKYVPMIYSYCLGKSG